VVVRKGYSVISRWSLARRGGRWDIDQELFSVVVKNAKTTVISGLIKLGDKDSCSDFLNIRRFYH
jgi:hypothetical protein